jgi:hypothetical protein
MLGERLFIRAAQRRQAVHVYHTPAGVKATHQPVKQVPFDRLPQPFSALTVPASGLFLGFDGLRDPFTLVGRPVAESPHRDLAQAIEEGRDLAQADYVQRLRAGTLDLRGPRPVRPGDLARLAATHAVRRKEAAEGTLAPVRVYRAGGRWHVADGKHRVALLHVLGLPVPCIDVTALAHDSFYWMVHDRMREQPDEYSRNLAFFAGMLEGRP